MSKLGKTAEFALVAAFGVTLTVRAAGGPATQPAASAAPSIEQIEAAVAAADAQAAAVNGRR
jgi:hypothetical protein